MTIQFPEAMRPLFQPLADDGTAVRHRAFKGGRGSSKSHGIAGGAVTKGATKPLRILCTRETQRSIRDSTKRLIEDKIAAYGLQGFYRSTETEIRGKNGTLFLFAGLRTAGVENIKSIEGIDLCLISEARSVSQASIDILIPTVRAPGSELWWDWNPFEPTDAVDQMFCGPDGPPPGTILREVNYPDNPFFPEVLRRQMEWDKRRDYAKYLHIWMGKYRKASGALVFKNWSIQDFDPPPEGTRFYYGADWGFSVDPSVLVRCWIDGRRLYIDYEAYEVGCTLDDTPRLFGGDPQYPDRYPGVPGAMRNTITADSARPETVDHMNRRGWSVVPALKGAGSVEDGIEFLKNFDIIVHPRCRNTIAELGSYSWKVDPKIIDPTTREPIILPALADKNNHVIDALRYAVEGERRGGYDMGAWA